jgi:membrane-bound lytic murein transglycosylase D
MKRPSLLLCLLLAVVPGPAALRAAQSFTLDQVAHLFPSEGFEHEIAFWTLIFTKYETNRVLFHDRDDLRLIYHVEEFDRGIEGHPAEARRQRDILRRKLATLQGLFDDIRAKGVDSIELGEPHRRIVGALREAGYSITPALLNDKKGNIRYQRGIRDKFRESLIRSGLYMVFIEDALRRNRVPTELSVLPHIESSFDYNAYSHAGAAGIWQFTRGTGRTYLKIDRLIDERLDPIRATEAAARFLSENYAALGNWPLTITSYNHGKYGMIRAKQRHGPDLREIIRSYQARSFGFASRNFYPEFLAALEIHHNYRRYFGDLPIAIPLEFDTVVLDRSFDAGHFIGVPGVTADDLLRLNPHLRRVMSAARTIFPAGIEVRVPPGLGDPVRVALRNAPAAGRMVTVAEDGSVRYRVREGDSLTGIAAEFQTSAADLQRLNAISNPNRIFPGQTLLVTPGSPVTSQAAVPPPPASYTVQAGDSLSSIAAKFGTTAAELARSNQLSNPDEIQPGDSLRITGAAAPSVPRRYVVRRGDTLQRIASRFGTSVEVLKDANGIRNPHLIRQGQEIVIP